MTLHRKIIGTQWVHRDVLHGSHCSRSRAKGRAAMPKSLTPGMEIVSQLTLWIK
jgi:hypothetical protein